MSVADKFVIIPTDELDEEVANVMEVVADKFAAFASEIDDLLDPESREKSLAMTNLEQAFLWAKVAAERSI